MQDRIKKYIFWINAVPVFILGWGFIATFVTNLDAVFWMWNNAPQAVEAIKLVLNADVDQFNKNMKWVDEQIAKEIEEGRYQ